MKYPALAIGLALAACSPGANDGAGTAASDAPAPTASAPTAPDSAVAIATLLGEGAQPKGKYAPRDDCGKLPGAAEFRRKLASAVLKGDADAVAALASPNVKLGFGGDDGRERFIEQLKEPGGELFSELKAVLPLGCAVRDDGMTMPWHFAQDMGEIDGYAATIVTGEEVPVLAEADTKAAVKQSLSWDVVLLNEGLYPDLPFQKVEVPGGAKGYVATGKLRSLLDYRLLADREGGEWKITAFLAGD